MEWAIVCVYVTAVLICVLGVLWPKRENGDAADSESAAGAALSPKREASEQERDAYYMRNFLSYDGSEQLDYEEG